MNRRIAIVGGLAALLALGSLALPMTRPLVWNVSASVPTGLYAIRGKNSLHVGDRIAIAPPPALRRLMAQRGYLRSGVPLLKRIAAVSGQRVCRFAHGITIDRKLVGVARTRDRAGRTLPAWFGCRRIGTGQVFVMNPDAPDSFDGRYFGVTKMHEVTGRATPIWTDEAGDGFHVWFAPPAISEPLD